MKKLCILLSFHIGLRYCLAACLLVALMLPLQASHANPEAGTTIHVDTTADELNSNASCSLREAIRAANLDQVVGACPAGNGADTILLPIGTFGLSIAGIDENSALTGDLDITADVRILGSGVETSVIDGNAIDRVFEVTDDNVKVGFYHLTIQNGYAAGTDLNGGGGVYNVGELTLSNCVVRNNHTPRIGGGVDSTESLIVVNTTFHSNSAKDGGGIYNGGTANLNSVTFYDNSATETGGAFDNWLTAGLTNVTISGNTAESGGGIFNDGDLSLLNVTLTDNSTGIANRGTVRAKSTLVANSVGGSQNNCTENSPTSEGNNLDSGTSCNFNSPTDWSNTDPLLDPLSDNEGPTLTHMLQPGSPAIDHGNDLECPRFDQRGAFRPADGDANGASSCDIGAVEAAAVFPTLIYLPIVRR